MEDADAEEARDSEVRICTREAGTENGFTLDLRAGLRRDEIQLGEDGWDGRGPTPPSTNEKLSICEEVGGSGKLENLEDQWEG